MDNGKTEQNKVLTDSQTDSPGNGPPANDRSSRAKRMPGHRTSSDPPVIAPRGHSDRRDLAPIAPLSEKRHYKCLHPRRAQQQ